MLLNLFAAAVSQAHSAPTEKKSKNDKLIIPATTCAADIDRLSELRGTIADFEAESAMLEGNVKAFGKQAFLIEASKAHRNIGSFYLKGNKTQMLFIPQDKYLTTLPAGLPTEITETKTTYIIPSEIVEKG